MSGTSNCLVSSRQSDAAGLGRFHGRSLRFGIGKTRKPLSRGAHRRILELRRLNRGTRFRNHFPIEHETDREYATQLSWKRALDTIDKRIELRGSDGESGSLRHWRGVIGQTYDDFQAKFSEYSPPLLASLALSVDGRTEDSSFPNLVIPREREPYGF